MSKVIDLVDVLKDGGQLISVKLINDGEAEIKETVHDTRRISLHKKSLYIAIKGENYDGHDFIKELDGISAVISEKDINLKNTTVFLVKDSIKSYGLIANHWREINNFKVLAISGSNGKTTTKELLYHILKTQNKAVFRNPRNFNNLIGVPYSILLTPSDIDFLILEFGMNNYGEIKKLSEIAEPDCGYLTNIGTAHIGFFNTKENILKAKTELYDYLMEHNKILYLNKDDKTLKEWASNLDYDKMIKISLSLDDKNLKKLSKIPDFKAYNLENAISVINLAKHFGIEKEDSIKALETFKFPKLRSNWEFINNFRFFVDCYNANYDSMMASLKFISEEKPRFDGRRVVVLGDMNELGDRTEELHAKIASSLQEFKIEEAFFVGKYSKFYQKDSSVPSSSFSDLDSLYNALKESLQDNDLILLKASRTIALEKILDFFKEKGV